MFTNRWRHQPALARTQLATLPVYNGGMTCVDECSVDGVYEAFHTELRRFVLRKVSDPAAADDILQDVYLRIHTHIDSLRDCSRLQSWVYQIARNAIIDHYRSRRPSAELSETLPELGGGFADGCENDTECELMESLGVMVGELPPKYREALSLTLYEGLTQQEAAERFGISLSGAKSHVQRARAMIRDSLLTCCHFAFDRYGAVLDYQERCCCCAAEEQGSQTLSSAEIFLIDPA
jgi:RNA polymerase sigma-70 factor, ECF subfamily